MVAGKQQSPRSVVPDREAEHAAEMLDAVGAVLLIEMKNHLDVRGRAEPVASGYQFLAKLRAIIDFAVADELDRLILVGKRLCPAGEIDRKSTRLNSSH